MATSSIGEIVKIDTAMARKILEAEKGPDLVAKEPPKGLKLLRGDISPEAIRRRLRRK